MKLKNSVAIVTGSSSGIGAAIARLFAEHGCHVVINFSNNEDSARSVACEWEKHGVKTLVYRANVAEDAECRAMVDATLEQFGRIDILVNNAGTTKFCNHNNLDGRDKQDFLDL